MKDDTVVKMIDNWGNAVNEIMNKVQMLDEKPAIIIHRAGSHNFRCFLNKKAFEAAEKIVKGYRCFWLDTCYFDESDGYLVKLNMPKEHRFHGVRDKTPPSESESLIISPYGETKNEFFRIANSAGRQLFGDVYFGPEFRFFFLCEDQLKTSEENVALYFKS